MDLQNITIHMYIIIYGWNIIIADPDRISVTFFHYEKDVYERKIDWIQLTLSHKQTLSDASAAGEYYTLRWKEKLQIMSNFSFSNNVFKYT